MAADIRCTADNLTSWSGDSLAVGLFSGDAGSSTRHLLIERFGTGVADRLEQRRFKGKPGECLSIDLLGQTPSLLVLIGLGAPAGFGPEQLRGAVAAASKQAATAGARQLGLAMPVEGLAANNAAAAMAEAVRLSLFCDQRFKSEADAKPGPERIELLGLSEDAQAAVSASAAVCSGVELARELVAAPPNVVTPAALADTAAAIAADFGLELKVLERDDCEALGMGSYLAVAQGSDLPPKFIHLTYRPAGSVERRLVLVGKGLTFDSGGYNLKTAGSQIDMMKYDMGGSAAVLGAMRAIAELKPAGVEVHMIVAACENMISGGAIHPGAIVKASNGKTIEINNTDAEGRLTLADALVYACKLEPDAVVDLATLTGACVIALGEEIAGLWSPCDALAQSLIEAGSQGGENLWRMPLRASYREGLKSGLADMKNTGPRPGGSITAALFLQDFVTPELPWAHLDIAGTVWSDKGRGLDPAGATGYGVRTLVNWVRAGGPA
ncbi:leucyl aminopeptidase [Synechococcus sp. CBW1107]|uniref:leucyl aminopeptidase n=1 Tax=Synechococcus sp. CBW1107 TaxID=2789857 RepID=UPI002AD2B53C|nr:leucyl aminopeptidase [Synechococcus sp. CBW1107]CAK6694098.1 putative cytosol aminopeptidase [Synechococcus sp. CBW1107]